jgi:two-component system sensor histidine kinase KdpD
VLALAVAALVPFRARLDKSHITLALLLVVLASAADGGRRTGLLTAGLAFLGFNWFFLPPYGTLVISDPLDLFVLLAFLGTSVVASHLFHRVQREADEARERAAEVSTLASLGAEAMSAPRAEGALRVVAETARTALGVAACRVHVVRERDTRDTRATRDTREGDVSAHGAHTLAAAEAVWTVSAVAQGNDSLDLEPVRMSLARGARIAILDGGIVRVITDDGSALHDSLRGEAVRRLLLPLRGGTRFIGVLDVEDARGFPLPETRERLIAALAYYAALGAERSRLERADAHLEAMREADQMRNALLASVSHDLRTPLTTIKALAHELSALGDERSDIIGQEADRLNHFVSDMLDVSRLASGRFPLRISVTPVDDLIATALQQVEGSFAGRRIDVQLPHDDHFPLARFDLTHSVRILVNLLENARKYAPGMSPVDIVVAREAEWIRIRVADRGPGIAPNERERIFDALYRPANMRPDVGSAGLGLAIGRGLAEAQGGSLTYAPREGGGSLFTLSLQGASLADLDEGDSDSR